MHRRARGQPGAEVQELADARRGGTGRGGAHELPVLPNQLRQRRIQLGHAPGHIPVDGEIVLPVQPEVVDTGDARPRHVDASGRWVLVGHNQPRLQIRIGSLPAVKAA